MRKLTVVQEKLLRKALYTSPLMAVPSISPILIKTEIPLKIYMYAVLIQSLVVLWIWLVNIHLFSGAIAMGFHESRNRLGRYIISYAFALFLILVIREFLFWWIDSPYFPEYAEKGGYLDPTRHTVPYYGVVLGFSINSVILTILDLIIVREKKGIAELENSRLKLKNAEIINQELKQQIHPHFLFNALNILKTLIHRQSDHAEAYLIRLSNFLRISIHATRANTVSLEEELSLCVDYLEMQKTRFGQTLKYTIDIPEERRYNGFVPIFSIQLLLENVIKHNAMYRDSPLHVRVVYEATSDRVIVINNRQPRETYEPSTGYGLDNLVERYRILSGDTVVIQPGETFFSVSIKVLAHENSHY